LLRRVAPTISIIAQAHCASRENRSAIVPKYNTAPLKNERRLREREAQTSYVVRRGITYNPLKVKGGGLELQCETSEKKPDEGKNESQLQKIKTRDGLAPHSARRIFAGGLASNKRARVKSRPVRR